VAHRRDQVIVDAAETESEAYYLRARHLWLLIGEAERRADAIGRLEAALRLQPRPG